MKMRDFFSKLFGKSNEDSSNAQSGMAEIPSIATEIQTTNAESQAADDQVINDIPASKSTYRPGVVTVDLHTGRPIDAIYLYIKQDNEQLGYNDAIRLHNMTAMEEGVKRIKNHLKTLLDQVNMKYQGRVLKQKNVVKTYKEMGYLNSESEAQYILDQLNYHIQEIERLRKDLETGSDNVKNMTETYEKGFKQGMLDIMGGGIHAVAPSSPSSSTEFAVIEG